MVMAALEERDTVVEALQAAQSFLIVTHQNPDGDAVGSSLGLRFVLEGLGKRATVVLSEGVPYRYRYLSGADEVVPALPAGARFDATVVLDTGELQRVGAELPGPELRGRLINIDHHATNSGFAEVTWRDERASSVGEMIHALAGLLGAKVTAEVAAALFCAVLTDTGSFRFSNTTPAALHAAAELVAAGARPEIASSAIFFSHPAGRLSLMARVLATLEVVADGRIASVCISPEMFEAVGGDASWVDEFVDFPRSIAGVEVAVLLRDHSPGKVKISLRSRGQVDVARIAEGFGGGGHRPAAGATIDGTLDEVRRRIHAVIEEAL